MSPRRLPTALLVVCVFAAAAMLLVRAPRASATTLVPAPAIATGPAALAAPAPIVVTGRLHLRTQPLTPGTHATVEGDGDCLRLRSGPSLGSGVITCLPDQSTVLVMPSTQVAGDYRWQLVSATQGIGWVADEFLADAPSAHGCAVADAQLAARPPGFSGTLPTTGIGATVWGGGTTDGVITAALAQGCAPTSIWAQESGTGKLIGYLTHVPAWVNQAWQAQFAGGEIPAGTILFVVCGGAPTQASVPLIIAPATAPTRQSNTQPPATKAAAAVIVDAASGEILYGDHEHDQLAPASLTKMATAVVAIEGSESGQWVVNAVDSRTLASDGDSVMGLRPGDCFQMQDLLYGLLLPSGNDAALAIAQYVGGSTSAFVGEMNTFAERLGLQNTSFTDPDGLGGPHHYSSAYDLAMIARYGMTLPLFRQIVETKTWTAHGSRTIPLHTLNQFLLNYQGADGLKTGWTPEAGPTLAVSAERDGHRLIAVVLNDQTRYTDVTNLMDWAFSTFRWP
jgi:D-alanyl-D-alanine carboxypeptidase (penicillin-binding protein 5/6)